MADEFDGVGGSYVIDKKGNRKLVERTSTEPQPEPQPEPPAAPADE